MFITFERLPSERSPCLRVIEIIVISVISILIHCICILLSLFMMVDSMQQTTTKEEKYFFKQKIKVVYIIIVLLSWLSIVCSVSRGRVAGVWCAIVCNGTRYSQQPHACAS